jgi:outer membrane protein
MILLYIFELLISILPQKPNQMKKLLTVLAFVNVSLYSQAQNSFSKSDIIAEGTVSYSKTKGADATYAFRPSVGYFVSDKIAVGIFSDISESGLAKNSGFGAYGRYYFLSLGKNLSTFTQLSLATNSATPTVGSKVNTTNVNIGVGLNYFVTSKLALTTNVTNLINYTTSKSNSNFTIGFNGITNPISTPTFGLLYRF